MQSGIQRCSILIFMDPRGPRRLKWSVGEGGGMRWEIAMPVVFNPRFFRPPPADAEPPCTQNGFWRRVNGERPQPGAREKRVPTAITSIFVSAEEERGKDSANGQWRKQNCDYYDKTRASPTTAPRPLVIACMQLLPQIRDHTACPTFTSFSRNGKADYYFIQPAVGDVRGN